MHWNLPALVAVETSPTGATTLMDDIDHRQARSPQAAPLTISVRAAAELASIRRQMRSWLSPSLSPADMDEVLLAAGEALANAIEHGAPPITLSLEWTGELLLQLRVRDSGAWRLSSETASRGLGIPIMTALMDSFTVETTDGTAIQLSRQFTT